MATGVDDYLGRVRRALAGMDRKVRDDIVRELGANLTESVRVNGGNVAAAIASLGPPAEVARPYREVYGYGRGYRAAFAVLAAILGIASLPVLLPGPEFGAASIAPAIGLSVLIVFLLWVSVAAGARAGLVAGTAAAIARIGGFLVLNLPYQYYDRAGVTLLLVVSALLVLLGWLPGRAKKVWKAPEAAL